MKKFLSFVLIISTLFTTVGISVNADSETVTFSVVGTENYDYAYEVLRLTNEARAKVGAAPLTMDASLLESAMQRAAECAIYYSHTRPDGSSCFSAVNRGYWSAGENIAIGYDSAEAVATGWINSEGHYANMISTSFSCIGIGCYKASNGTLCWVQLFTDGSATDPQKSGSNSATRSISALSSNLSLVGESMVVASGSNSTLVINNTNITYRYCKHTISPDCFTYFSDNTAVATVNANGTVTAVDVGTATITATMKSAPSLKITAQVRVNKSSTLTFNDDQSVTGIPLGATAGDYYMYDVTDPYGNLLMYDDAITTGCYIYNGYIPYKVIVKGDINGDYNVNSTDFTLVRRQYLGMYSMCIFQSRAADVNSDGLINSTDFVQIRKHFLGLYDLYA